MVICYVGNHTALSEFSFKYVDAKTYFAIYPSLPLVDKLLIILDVVYEYSE